MTDLAGLFLAIAAVSAVANWVAVGVKNVAVEYVAKPLTMAALTAVAIAVDPTDTARQAWFIAAAVFCIAGDVFLMLPRDRFVPGLVAFLVAHLCYVVGFTRGGQLSVLGAALGGLIVVGALVAVGRPVLAAVRREHHELLGPVMGYLVVISAMVVVAFSAGPWIAAGGALLFYASDSVIAWRRFLQAGPWSAVVIMVTYHAAQFALIGSLALPPR